MEGALPILLTEIEAYCRIVETPVDDRPAFVRVIRLLDLGWLDLLYKRKSATITKPET